MAHEGVLRRAVEIRDIRTPRVAAAAQVREVRRASSVLAAAILLALGYGALSLFGDAGERSRPWLHWSVGDATQSVLAAGCLIALAAVGVFATTRPRYRAAGWLTLAAWLALTSCLSWAAVTASTVAGGASPATPGSGEDTAATASHLAAAAAIALTTLALHALVAGTARDRRWLTASGACLLGFVAVAASYLSAPAAAGAGDGPALAYTDPFGFGDLTQASGPHNGLAGLGCLGTVLLFGALGHAALAALRALRSWRGPAGEPLLPLVLTALVAGVVAATALVLLTGWWSDGRRIAAVYAGVLLTIGAGAVVWHTRAALTAVADRLGGSAAAAGVRRALAHAAAESGRLARQARSTCLDRLAPSPGSGPAGGAPPRCVCGHYLDPADCQPEQGF